MAIIKLIDVISCSSQEKGYGAENLMFYHLKKPWLSSPSDPSRQIEAEFQLYKACQIDFIDIGNFGSSTFEVQVGRSSNPTIYTTLLPAVTLLNVDQLKEGQDKKSVFMFNLCNMIPKVAEQKWDRVKVICRQPYSKKLQFGLKFLLIRTKNNWEIESNEEIKDLFVEEKSHYSAPLRDQCARLPEPDNPSEIKSRGQQLVEASRNQMLVTPKILEIRDSFKEEVRIFLIACSDEVFNGLSSDGCMEEFERQCHCRLNPKQFKLFQDVYREFKVTPSTDKAIKNKSDFDAINLSNIPLNENTLKKDSSFKLNANKSKRSSSLKLNSTSDEIVILEEDSSQHQNVNSFSGKIVSKFPVHPSVSSLRSQKNSSDISKTVKIHPKYHHKESTLVGSVSRSPKHNKVHSSIKRRCENSSDAGSSKKNKTSEQFPTRAKKSYNRPEDFIQFDGSQPSTSKGFTLVDCPICQESFHPSAIEQHAATCGDFDASDGPVQISGPSTPCPFCAGKFPTSEVDLHIENCFRFY